MSKKTLPKQISFRTSDLSPEIKKYLLDSSSYSLAIKKALSNRIEKGEVKDKGSINEDLYKEIKELREENKALKEDIVVIKDLLKQLMSSGIAIQQTTNEEVAIVEEDVSDTSNNDYYDDYGVDDVDDYGDLEEDY